MSIVSIFSCQIKMRISILSIFEYDKSIQYQYNDKYDNLTQIPIFSAQFKYIFLKHEVLALWIAKKMVQIKAIYCKTWRINENLPLNSLILENWLRIGWGLKKPQYQYNTILYLEEVQYFESLLLQYQYQCNSFLQEFLKFNSFKYIEDFLNWAQFRWCQ